MLNLMYITNNPDVARIAQRAGVQRIFVAGRARTMPLLETDAAVRCIDDILAIKGIDEVFVGLNDLALSRGQGFMFEPMVDGTVEALARKFDRADIPWGFGGIASLGRGMLHSERIIAEHYRMGSRAAILSRSFCNAAAVEDLEAINAIFTNGLHAIRDYEGVCDRRLAAGDAAFFEKNRLAARDIVRQIAQMQREKAENTARETTPTENAENEIEANTPQANASQANAAKGAKGVETAAAEAAEAKAAVANVTEPAE